MGSSSLVDVSSYVVKNPTYVSDVLPLCVTTVYKQDGNRIGVSTVTRSGWEGIEPRSLIAFAPRFNASVAFSLLMLFVGKRAGRELEQRWRKRHLIPSLRAQSLARLGTPDRLCGSTVDRSSPMEHGSAPTSGIIHANHGRS